MQGTPEYASINAHLGCAASAASELEAAIYVFLQLAGIAVPWLGVRFALALEKTSMAAREAVCVQAKVVWLLGGAHEGPAGG